MIFTWIPFLLLGWFLARRAFLRASLGETLALGVSMAIALLIVETGLIGRWLHHFSQSILLGAGLSLAAGLTIWRIRGVATAPFFMRRWTLGRLFCGLLVVAVTALIVRVAWRFAIFDEWALQGHLTVIESLLRGNYPPTYVAFPEVAYRYHFGFNILAAYLALIFRVPAYVGADLATLLYWLSFVALLVYFLRRFGVSDRGLALGLLLVTLSGGLCWLLSNQDLGLYPALQIPDWQQMFVHKRQLSPQFMMYLFQHPMGLGLCLFLGATLAMNEWFESFNPWALVMGIIQLGALSLSQVVLFATALAALGLVFAWHCLFSKGMRPRYFTAGLLVGGFSVALAFGLGGFFSISPYYENQPLLISWPPSYLGFEFWGGRYPLTWMQAWVWYLGCFGLFLVAIPLAWIAGFRKRRFIFGFLALFSLLCFAVPHFFRYVYSWDIIKWFFGFELSGKLLLTIWVLPWALRDWKRETLAWALVLFSAVTPFRFLADLALQRTFTPKQMRTAVYRQEGLQNEWRPVIDWILSSPAPQGRLWASPDTTLKIARLTGLATVQTDRILSAMPISRKLLEDRKAAVLRLERSPAWSDLRQLGVTWVVFTCQEASKNPALGRFLIEIAKRPEVRTISLGDEGRSCRYFYQVSGAQ